MISKELAKAVLSGERGKAVYSDGEVLVCTVNIHELQSLCKNWALNNGYVIASFKDHCGQSFATITSGFFGMKKNPIQADTEPEAVIKACQWILDNKGKYGKYRR